MTGLYFENCNDIYNKKEYNIYFKEKKTTPEEGNGQGGNRIGLVDARLDEKLKPETTF